LRSFSERRVRERSEDRHRRWIRCAAAEEIEEPGVGRYGRFAPQADEDALAKRHKVGIREAPGVKMRVVRREVVRTGGERGARDDEDEDASGGERLGEADEEAVLASPVVGIRVVGRIEEEDGGAVAGEAERQCVAVVRVAAGEAVAQGLGALGLELDSIRARARAKPSSSSPLPSSTTTSRTPPGPAFSAARLTYGSPRRQRSSVAALASRQCRSHGTGHRSRPP